MAHGIKIYQNSRTSCDEVPIAFHVCKAGPILLVLVNLVTYQLVVRHNIIDF